MSKRVLVLNGPGLEGIAQISQHYKRGITLACIREACAQECKTHGFEMSFHQSEKDDEIFSIIATDAANYDLFVINPISHFALDAAKRLELYRIAIKALALRGVFVVEVHMNNIFQKSDDIIAPLQEPGAQIGFISGLGIQSYTLAIESLALKQAE